MTSPTEHNEPPSYPRNEGRGGVLFGAILIGLGAYFLARQMGFLEGFSLKIYWPVILMVFGLFRLVAPSHAGQRGWGLILLVVGTVFLLRNLNLLDLEWDYIWPSLIILFGLWVILKAFATPRHTVSQENSHDGVVHGLVVLGGKESVLGEEEFRGGVLQSILGSYRLDLHGALLSKAAVLNVTAVMGSIELLVPAHWKVRSEVTPVMGSFEDKRRQITPSDNAPELIIRGQAVMGSVELLNG